MIIGAVILVLLTIGFIIFPFFKRTPAGVRDEDSAESAAGRDVLASREIDIQTGLMDEEEQNQLPTSQQEKAAQVTGKIARTKEDEAIDQMIEKEVRQLRQNKGLSCPKCGSPVQKGDRFCSVCGTRLQQGDKVD